MPNELLLLLTGGACALLLMGGGYLAMVSARKPTRESADFGVSGSAWGGIVGQFQQQLKERDGLIQALQAKVAAYEAEMTTMRAELQTCNTKIEQLETALDVFQEQVNDERKRNKALNKEGSILYSELQTLKQTTAPTLPANLRALLKDRLAVEDVKALCFDLGVDFESFPAGTLGEKIIALLDYVERRQRVGDLLAALRRARPDVKV